MSVSYFWNFPQWVPVVLSGIPSVFLTMLTYVLTAFGLYDMAKLRGIENPWLAWIPVANIWILGSLSDQYRYVARGQICSKRKSLLILKLMATALGLVMFSLVTAAVVRMLFGSVQGLSADLLLRQALHPSLSALCLVLPYFVVKLAGTVLSYIALYDVYTSCDPENSVLFLVFSILFGVTKPFFLFFNRKKERGMPPRMDAQV